MFFESNQVFIANDFFDIAGYETVRSTLNRLVEDKVIIRIMKGIYYKPKYIELIGEYEAPFVNEAYNILRIIGQSSLKSSRSPKTKRPVKRRRIRTVISNLLLIAGHVTEHARQVVLALGCSNIWRHTFMDLYRQFMLV